MKVEKDPEITEIEEALPGLDCGTCGYPGCQQLPKKVAKGEALSGSCVPGGDEFADAEEVVDILED